MIWWNTQSSENRRCSIRLSRPRRGFGTLTALGRSSREQPGEIFSMTAHREIDQLSAKATEYTTCRLTFCKRARTLALNRRA